MEVLERLWLLTAILASTLLVVQQVESCNEALCAPVVSKCMLTQSCKCELTIKNDCTCCKECFMCLGDKYTDCCSCVGICPKKNDTKSLGDLSKQSNVEDFNDDYTGLFTLYTDHPDEFNRWKTFTYPVEIDISTYNPKVEKDIKYQTIDNEEQKVHNTKDKVVILNCTVIFQTQCMSYTKCRDTCLTMGASSVRWFHDGCCECVGESCINYGINESRCTDCPMKRGDDEFDVDKNDLVYDSEVVPDEEEKPLDYEEATSRKVPPEEEEVKKE
ncbi:protein twisted gastrulation-like [Neocloeon triangulifer]|uniref:protein twisted gastrulation-like n=1 Tax=Neocloeon triangulifer TaxID=2078957 RepID=UPI00286ED865|nr:protein twisted gastrulation-like [Neocloeon triangulifer]XP_059472593.1 protein twisted gastrulation-like [Neocloeon triangulifer]